MRPSRTPVIRRFAEDGPRVLPGGLEVDVEVLDDRRALIGLRGAGGAVSLMAAGLSVLYPSGLKRLRSELPEVELVVVEHAPAGLRAAFEREGLSWVDLGGAGHVESEKGRVIYDVPVGAPVGPARRRRVSPFAPAASRVVRVLLSDRSRGWRLSEIVELAEVNPGNAHRVLGELVERGLVERDEYAYAPIDPGRMLDVWADHYEAPRERVVSAADGELVPFVKDLVADGGEVVVSGELAAEMLAPHLPAGGAITHCLSREAFAEISRRIEGLTLESRSEGQVIVDLADTGYGAFSVQRAGLPLAAPIQIYLDLARDPGRGREAAQHLRREAIGF